MHDLFGQPLPKAKEPPQRKIGYAARPGGGPKGQRCNTCKFCIVVVCDGRRARKCELVARIWTTGTETDIKHNAPACRHWERKSFPDADS